MRGKHWLILVISLAVVLLASSVGVTRGSFVDLESSIGNTFQAWTSTKWVQTTQADFDAGVLSQVDTSSNPGDVKLESVSEEPTTSAGSEESWHYTSWSRRAPVTIDNPGSGLTDYQVRVDVTYDADMQADFDDIRFVDSDDSTELSHWRESYTASTSAIFWVKVPSIPSGGKTIYMYYGNAAASNASDGNATFEFFDDFEEHASGEDPDGWTDQGTENFYVALHDSEKWFQVNTFAKWEDGSTASSMANIGDAVWSAKVYYHQLGTNAWGGIGVHIGNGGVGRIVVIRDGGWYRANEPDWSSGSGWQTNADIHFPIGTKGRIELVTNGTTLDAYWYNPPGYSPEKVTVFTGFIIPSGTGKLDVHIERPGTGLDNNRWVDADDIIVRKYVSPEPTTSIGSEDGWGRWAPVTINNPGSGLTDYQVRVDVTYDADMQPDFDDIRFVDSDDSTELSHWRESYTASTSAIFWVKVPSIPSGSKTIYMYYGNAAASSASDGTATFVFFDDFDDTSLGAAWTFTQVGGAIGSYTESGTVIRLTGTDTGDLWDSSDKFLFLSISGNYDNVVVESYTTAWGGSHGGWSKMGGAQLRQSTDANSKNRIMSPVYSSELGTNSYRLSTGGTTAEQYPTIRPKYNRVSRTGGASRAWYSTDGITWTELSSQISFTGGLTDPVYLGIHLAGLSSAEHWVEVDWFRVRKYPPPSKYVSPGTIASQVLDTGVTGARWDALFWDETLQSNTDITFEVRASDTSFAKGDASLSWTSVGGTSPVTSGLPSGRYMQWRPTLTTSDTSETPTLHEVRVYHY